MRITHNEFLIILTSFLCYVILIPGLKVDVNIITIIILITITICGVYLSHLTAKKVGDNKVEKIRIIWLIKIMATIFLLKFGWINDLENATMEEGYDPQRYYLYSQSLLENNWQVVDFSLNYVGIVYYYSVIFGIFGVNPLIPAVINAFVTLLGILYLIVKVYKFTPKGSCRRYKIIWILLIPEVIWFDVMTSRETLMTVLLTTGILNIGSMIFDSRNNNKNRMILAVITIVGVMAIRSSMIIPLLVATVLMFIISISDNKKNYYRFVLYSIVIFIAGMFAPFVQDLLGGYKFNYSEIISSTYNINQNIASEMDWSKNSIGFLISPNNWYESILYLPLRMLIYIAAPLPQINISIEGLILGDYVDWQNLMVIPSSALMLMLFPYVLSGSAYAWKSRKLYPQLLIIPIGFWVLFASVAGGNIIIHERYRIMFVTLLYACVWTGYTQCTFYQVKRWAYLWWAILTFCAILYILFKS